MGKDFDRARIFNQDYLYFYAERVSEAATAEEVTVLRTVSGLQAGGKVLDLACGHGRISNHLAKLGARVVGLDATIGFLDVAQADASLVCSGPPNERGDPVSCVEPGDLD